MGKIGCAIQRIHIPAELSVEALACSLFPVNSMLGECRTEPRSDQGFAGAVSLGDQVDIAFCTLFSRRDDRSPAAAPQPRARDGLGGRKKPRPS